MNDRRLNDILAALTERKIAVLGDFCVDRYLHIDPEIVDNAKETGLPIHQVVRVRPEPGGGANVVKNIASLGVGAVYPVGYLGLDGEGFELGRLFDALGVERDFLQFPDSRHTPAFTKPIICRPDQTPEELNRFDIFPREPMSEEMEDRLIEHLGEAFEAADAVVVADYTEAGKHGVVTPRVRDAVIELARGAPQKPVLADSRLNIDQFRHVIIKPNAAEAMAMAGREGSDTVNMVELTEIGEDLSRRNQRPVLITLGPEGSLLCAPGRALKIPVFPSEQYAKVDIVGAGDEVMAAVAGALAGGAGLDEATVIGMVAASVSIEEIGTCGTATPDQIRRRFKEYAHKFPDMTND